MILLGMGGAMILLWATILVAPAIGVRATAGVFILFYKTILKFTLFCKLFKVVEDFLSPRVMEEAMGIRKDI